jgi:hypothetical protein
MKSTSLIWPGPRPSNQKPRFYTGWTHNGHWLVEMCVPGG